MDEKEKRKIKVKIKKIADRKRDLSRVFRDDEKSALRKLELLKRKSNYIEFFSKYRDKVKEAYAGRMANDEEVQDTLAHFYVGLKFRFGVDLPFLRPRASRIIVCDDLLALLDPATASEEIPAAVRSFFLPRMFFTPGIIPISNDPDGKTVIIKMRGKKKAQLLKEYAAFLDLEEASRDTLFDRSRDREQTPRHLEVWEMVTRRGMKFEDIAKELDIKPSDAEYSFGRAHELIQGFPCPPGELSRLRGVEKSTLATICEKCDKHSDRGGDCTEPCEEIEKYAAQNERRWAREVVLSQICQPTKGNEDIDQNPPEDSLRIHGKKVALANDSTDLDPCGNPIKRREVPLLLTPEEKAKRLRWAKEATKGVDTPQD